MQFERVQTNDTDEAIIGLHNQWFFNLQQIPMALQLKSLSASKELMASSHCAYAISFLYSHHRIDTFVVSTD
jgi:hypothetical protein